MGNLSISWWLTWQFDTWTNRLVSFFCIFYFPHCKVIKKSWAMKIEFYSLKKTSNPPAPPAIKKPSILFADPTPIFHQLIRNEPELSLAGGKWIKIKFYRAFDGLHLNGILFFYFSVGSPTKLKKKEITIPTLSEVFWVTILLFFLLSMN